MSSDIYCYINPIIEKLNEVTKYCKAIEDRLDFVLKQNGAYKNRNIILTKALEEMIMQYCQIGETLNHKQSRANMLAFEAIGLKNGSNVEVLENLLKNN